MGEAYRLAWENREEYLKISWCWMAIAFPIFLIIYRLASPSFSAVLCMNFKQLQNSAPIIHSYGYFFYSFFKNLLWLPITASIAVAWHRLILRGERVAGMFYLRFDRVVLSYLNVGFLIFFLEQLPTLITVVLTPPNDVAGPMFLLSTGLFVLEVFILIYIVRLPVLLPARALAMEGVTLKDVMIRTRWDYWRLFWGQIFTVLPLAFFISVAGRLGCGDDGMGSVLHVLSTMLCMFVTLPVFLSYLSLCYRHFFESDARS